MINVKFNGNVLSTFNGTNGILVQEIHHAGKSNRQAQTYALSHGNRSAIPYVEYPNKPITIEGKIIGSSIADCDAQIDTFNSYLTGLNEDLDFDYNGGSYNRRYIATCTNVDVTRPGYLAWAEFNITFIATNPFGQDTNSTTLLNATSRTSSSYSDALTFGGTAPFQSPILTLTYSALTGSGAPSDTVTLGNNNTNQSILVNRHWSSGDILLIDCTLSTNTPVTVNGVPVEFTGAFPDFAPGAGTLNYSDTFASRTFAENVIQYKYYL